MGCSSFLCELGQEINQENLSDSAKRIIREIAFLDGGSLVRLEDQEISDEKLRFWSRELVNGELVLPGHKIVAVGWRYNQRTFSTLGTVRADGNPVFEPVLYFTPVEVYGDAPAVFVGSQRHGPFGHAVRNGFGKDCVKTRWTVSLENQNCEIADPEPHINFRSGSPCVLWEARTLFGETPWTSRSARCRDRGFGSENCIKWVAATYYASGFTNIEFDGEAKTTLRGVELRGALSFTLTRFGISGELVDSGNLCAMGVPE